MKFMTLLGCGAVFFLSDSLGAITFNFTPEPGMDQEAVDGFTAAGELWSGLLSDNITVNVDIGFGILSPGVLGATGSAKVQVGYQQFVNALSTDQRSADDTNTVGSLQNVPTFALMLNRTRNSPHGPGSAIPFLDNDSDANNRQINITRANAKALGLLQAAHPSSDGSIKFSSDFNWDFDPDNGIQVNHFNFVFVAAHEIGHLLGFSSGVDILDINSPPINGPFHDHLFTFVSPADVFRFSNVSIAQGAATIDWAADTRDKYFSADGGTTDLGDFSTGRNFGDGQQASHWKDDRGLGIMDPTVAPGEVGTITTLDARLFDVIGYDLAITQPPVNADLAVSIQTTVTVTYTISATNLGPDGAVGAVVTSQFPLALSGITWQCASTGGATCTASGTGDVQDTINLPSGATATYTATGTASAFGGTVATIVAPSGVTDNDQGNNSASDNGGNPP